MHIKKATMNELNRIEEIYAKARIFMIANKNPNQWSTNWPPQEKIIQDIESQKLYLCIENDEILAVFFYDYGFKIEPNYNQIEGKWLGEESYGVIHRLASNGASRGAASFCIEWAYLQCSHLRIDTHQDNFPMLRLLEKLGFKKCGEIRLGYYDKSTRIAFERL